MFLLVKSDRTEKKEKINMQTIDTNFDRKITCMSSVYVFEFFNGFCVSRIFVRMILQGQLKREKKTVSKHMVTIIRKVNYLSISLLDFIGRSSLRNSQHNVQRISSRTKDAVLVERIIVTPVILTRVSSELNRWPWCRCVATSVV